ncbi:MAG TPA: hypothetical protein VEO54_26255 [Thermoanaerobaculia bacterium]|nr:hypothetical protein [Thermoanaerobaculia bacterium]
MTFAAQWWELAAGFGIGLIVVSVAAAVARRRHRRADLAYEVALASILGCNPERMPSLLHALADEVQNARTQFDYLPRSVPEEPWTVRTWSTKWVELLRDRDARSAWIARTWLETGGDRRSLDDFVKETVRLQSDLHRLLFGKAESAAVSRTDCVTTLSAAVAAVRELQSQTAPGLLRELEDLRADRTAITRELQKLRDDLNRASDRVAALAPLLTLCDVGESDDDAHVTAAIEDVGMLLLVARRETESTALSKTATLASALEARLKALHSAEKQSANALAETQRALAHAQKTATESVRLREEALATCRRHEEAAGMLAARLELTPNDHELLEHLLHGEAWTLRLLLLATETTWSSASAPVTAQLAALLQFADVPSQCSAALAALRRLVASDPPAIRPVGLDVVADLCRLADTAARISEFHGIYRLQELDAAAPWAAVVATTVKSVLAARGVEVRRPPLLQRLGSDFHAFEANHRDAPMTSFHAIRERIRAEVDRGNDGCVVDVTQSEIVIDGTIRRIGVASCMTPHLWRA